MNSPNSNNRDQALRTFGPAAPPMEDAHKKSLPKKVEDLNIVIAGAGIFGLWTAFFLRNKGYNVSLYDPYGPGNPRSSSGGESRLYRGIYGKGHLYTGMSMRSIRWWRELEVRSGKSFIHKTGSLWFAYEQDVDFIKDSLPYLEKLRLPYERLNPEEAQIRYPDLNFQNLNHVIHEEQSGYILARSACIQLLEEYRNLGGTYIPDKLIPGKTENGKLSNCLLPNGDKVEGDIFIYCGGPWLKKLFPFFDDILKISRQEMYYFGFPAGHEASRKGPILPWVDWGTELFYGIPHAQGRGFKIACDRKGPAIDPDNLNRMVTEEGLKEVRNLMSNRFPFMADSPLLESRVCQYTNTSDGNFIMDRHPQASNLWLGGGGSGHGFKHGPEFGRLMAKSVLCDEPQVEIFKLDRF